MKFSKKELLAFPAELRKQIELDEKDGTIVASVELEQVSNYHHEGEILSSIYKLIEIIPYDDGMETEIVITSFAYEQGSDAPEINENVISVEALKRTYAALTQAEKVGFAKYPPKVY